MKYLLTVFFIICSNVNAKSISPDYCKEMMQQDETYWCLMDEYQKSVIELKREEAKAEQKLKKYDEQGAKVNNEEVASIDYEPYVHLASQAFPELHREYIFYREKQCKFTSLRLGGLPGYHNAIATLYCKTGMNISQIQWIKDAI